MSKIIGVTVGTTLPKPNFKQSDPTKGDYIKNRPFYEIFENEIVVEEQTVQTMEDRYVAFVDLSYLEGIVPDSTYIVHFDNSIYEFVAWTYEGWTYIGDNALLDIFPEEDKYPFLIAYSPDGEPPMSLRTRNGGTHTISIELKKSIVKKIDEKFLPDGADENDAMEMLVELGVIELMQQEDGSILTDENGNILTI